jgi:hypothetical protein
VGVLIVWNTGSECELPGIDCIIRVINNNIYAHARGDDSMLDIDMRHVHISVFLSTLPARSVCVIC